MSGPCVRSRRLSLRFGVATIDQGIASLSNFVVGAAIARIAGLSAFGAYSLVYAGWVLLAGFHRSLITDPMSIENDMHSDKAVRSIRVGLAAELWLGVSAGVISAVTGIVLLLLLHQHGYGVCFVAIAPAIPFLLAQDYWRWIGFMKDQPEKALANDVVFDAVQVGVFTVLYVAGMRSAVMAIISWGVGALAGSLFGAMQHRVVPTLRGGIQRIRERWYYSKWLATTNLIGTATTQSTLVLSGAILGPAGLGGLKSALNLVTGPSMVLIQAAGSVGLPEAAKQLARRGWPGLRQVQRWICLASVVTVGALLIVILIAGRQILDLVYGPGFGRFATVADIVAVSLFITSFSHGAVLALKVTRQNRRLIPVGACSIVVSILSVAILAPAFGVTGAAWANLIGNVARTVGLLVTHWRRSRQAAESMIPSPTLTVHDADDGLRPDRSVPAMPYPAITQADGAVH